jgi:KTSC domain
MKQIFILLLFLSTFANCNSQSCETLPKSFVSYESALQLINQSKFEFTDKVNTSKSSWLSEAKFFSCDNKIGFFTINTIENDVYVHQNLPIELWNEFKAASSFGQYYSQHIRNKYRLKLN